MAGMSLQEPVSRMAIQEPVLVLNLTTIQAVVSKEDLAICVDPGVKDMVLKKWLASAQN
jgi:hypothetical protein